MSIFMFKGIKDILCKHEYRFHCNLYGDQIQAWNYKRSLWKCRHCGQIEAREHLHQD